MENTIGGIIRELINAYDYTTARIFYNDELIEFIKEYFPRDYSYFAQKEDEYQELIKSLNNEN